MTKSKYRLAALWGMFAAYAVVVLLLALNHEYWFDEAQAWNIARDNDIAGIIRMAKYEGHPPLWHFILKLFALMNCSCKVLGIVSWGFSVLTAAIIVFALPIKIYLKAALLLSSGMIFYNSAISRIYCVIYFLLVLIAWLYPKRKAHPLLFGSLVALLANTHICMCGLVGIIGIFMLIDYFKDFKGNSPKQNIFNTLGLLVAGAGVVALVLPLLGSLGTNVFTAESTATFTDAALSFATAFSNVVQSSCAANFPFVVSMLLSAVSQILLLLSFILLRRQRGTLVMLLVFSGFYLFVTEVVWYTSPCRGALYVFSLVMIYVMGEKEEVSGSETKLKADSKLMRTLFNVFARLDSDTRNSVGMLLAAVLAVSTPIGIKNAADDIINEFSPSEAAARFISENIPEDALLLTGSDNWPEILAYIPGREIFSIEYGRFYTYCSHEIPPEEPDIGAIKAEAALHDRIYYITSYDVTFGELVYENDNYIEYDTFGNPVLIYLIGEDEIDQLIYDNEMIGVE